MPDCAPRQTSGWRSPPMAVRLLVAACALAVGCSGPRPAAEARASHVGVWQSLDTLVFEVPVGEDFEGGEPPVYRILWSHLTITDSLWTETAVAAGPDGFSEPGLDAYEQSMGYSAAGDSLFLRPGDDTVAMHAVVRGDTLLLRQPAPTHTRARYVRSEPLTVDSGLVGVWSGFTEPDAAGVPAEIGFRFAADGTYQNGWGEPQGRFALAGPYLLLEDRESTEAFADMGPPGMRITRFRAIPAEVRVREGQLDRLVLGPAGAEDRPLVLSRR